MPRRSAPPQAEGGSAPASVEAELQTAQDAWQVAILIEVGNFAVLRRYVGRVRAQQVSAELAQTIADLFPDARVQVLSADLIELTSLGEGRDALARALATIEAAFEQAIELDGERFGIEVTLGGATVAAPAHDEVRLIEEAEQALRDARNERSAVGREVAGSTTADRKALASDLHGVTERNELFLQYQPKINIRRQDVAGVEALVRWRHPTRGLVMPGDFIPIAEESRSIVALTLWTLRQAIKDQRTLATEGFDIPVFLNIAGVLLADVSFVRQACALVAGSGAKIGFEITETSVIRDPVSAIANLKAFSDIGITIAIDDYGAGLSSLAYLKQLPARELKIDKLFITQLTSSNRDPLIVRSTIDLAHALEMEVVAEGVETHSALALLTVMGCDVVQGFLISRPIGMDALLIYLREGKQRQTHEELRGNFPSLPPARHVH